MGRYRKLPVEIEAVQFNPNGAAFALPGWFTDAALGGRIKLTPDGAVIETLEGIMTASSGDFIIQGVKGEIYPCKPDIFAATYEPIPTDEVLKALPPCITNDADLRPFATKLSELAAHPGGDGMVTLNVGDAGRLADAYLVRIQPADDAVVERAFREGYGLGVISGGNQGAEWPMREGKALDAAWKRSAARAAIAALASPQGEKGE